MNTWDEAAGRIDIDKARRGQQARSAMQGCFSERNYLKKAMWSPPIVFVSQLCQFGTVTYISFARCPEFADCWLLVATGGFWRAECVYHSKAFVGLETRVFYFHCIQFCGCIFLQSSLWSVLYPSFRICLSSSPFYQPLSLISISHPPGKYNTWTVKLT